MTFHVRDTGHSGQHVVDTSYGQRLVAHLVDQTSQSTPDRLFCFSPRDSGYEEITYGKLANGIDNLSWWIVSHFGRSDNFKTIAYLGPPDLRYFMFAIAAQKTGYQAFFPSPRNSLDAQVHLLEETSCEIFVTSSTKISGVDELLHRRPMRQEQMPDMEILLQASRIYPFDRSFDQAKQDPFVILHTSGSTGLPKAVTLSQSAFASNDGWHLLAQSDRERSVLPFLEGKKVFLGLPLFHAAGMWAITVLGIYFGTVFILIPSKPLTAELVNTIHTEMKPQVSIMAPSLIEDIVTTPGYFENLSLLDYVIYGGGPLSKEAGEAAMQKTSVLTLLGSTEALTLLPEVPDREDWQYLGFSPCLGLEFRHHSDDLYEMVIVRKPEIEKFQAVFKNFPHLQEFATKDLFSRHPHKPGYWLHKGRADDILVFSTGEKINPVAMEGSISLAPGVQGVLVAGQGQFQSALLVEPKSCPVSSEELIDRIWPVIEKANESCPAHGRIFRDFVLLTSPDKPMKRASKGTIQRQATISLYQKELEALYSSRGGSIDLNLQDVQSLRRSLRDVLTSMLNTQLSDDDDLFAHGLDSIKVATLVRLLNGGLHSASSISPPLIYGNPTVSSLSDALSLGNARQDDLDSLLSSLCERLSGVRGMPTPRPDSHVVILTGSTGSIGSNILHALILNESVSKIICLNRPHDVEPIMRQRKAMQKYLLPTDLNSPKVSFHHADLGKPDLGLASHVYKQLLDTATHIIHSAWEVNFNLSLGSFIEPHVTGVRNLINFALASRHAASVIFLSTIGTAMNWAGSMPEVGLPSWDPVQDTGYAKSKAVCERLLEHAASVLQLNCVICRVGQVAGPISRKGLWNEKEWFPSLVQSSAYLNVLPGDLGPMQVVDWIPVDVLASSLVEITFHGPSSGAAGTVQTRESGGSQNRLSTLQVYHLVNPKRVDYQRLLPVIRNGLPHAVRTVSLEEWVDLVTTTGDEFDNPARKLSEFFHHLVEMKKSGSKMVELDTSNACGVSQSLRQLGPVQREWMRNWMDGWALQ